MPLKKRSHVSPEFNLAAMIDIIFLLLLFFMLSSKLVNTNALNLDLPASGKTQTSMPSSMVDMSIKKDGSIYIDASQVSTADLRKRMIAAVDAAKTKSKSNDDVSIVLNTEKSVEIQDVVRVMAIANELKLRLVLATSDKDIE